MPHPWIPNSAENIKKKMLDSLGINDVMELFNDVPNSLLIREKLKVGFGRPLTEYEVRRSFDSMVSRNVVFTDPPPFIGGGVCYHYVPSAVKALITRSEFYTAYTPYQPEIAQGLLQAIFEYQSMMAELYGVDVINASLYNVSTATAEAVRMAVRAKRGRKTVLVPRNTHPEIREVLRTWSLGGGFQVREIPYDPVRGSVDLGALSSKLSDDVAAIYIEQPNFFGVIEEELPHVVEAVHKAGAYVIVNSLPISLGVLEAPGKLGADIVVGDTQSLGNGLNFGGPTAGILGIKMDRTLLRQLPGRLIGATKSVEGETGFMMVLQTREQHIKRERATSNITTNSNLQAIAASIYLALLGSEGLRKLSLSILGRTKYLITRLEEVSEGLVRFRGSNHFREVVISLGKEPESLIKKLIKEGIHLGPPLNRFYEELKECSLVCVTEAHTRSDIDGLIEALKEVVGGA